MAAALAAAAAAGKARSGGRDGHRYTHIYIYTYIHTYMYMYICIHVYRERDNIYIYVMIIMIMKLMIIRCLYIYIYAYIYKRDGGMRSLGSRRRWGTYCEERGRGWDIQSREREREGERPCRLGQAGRERYTRSPPTRFPTHRQDSESPRNVRKRSSREIDIPYKRKLLYKRKSPIKGNP